MPFFRSELVSRNLPFMTSPPRLVDGRANLPIVSILAVPAVCFLTRCFPNIRAAQSWMTEESPVGFTNSGWQAIWQINMSMFFRVPLALMGIKSPCTGFSIGLFPSPLSLACVLSLEGSCCCRLPTCLSAVFPAGASVQLLACFVYAFLTFPLPNVIP